MVVAVMKTSYRKSQPKLIHCRSYKNFSNDIFRDSFTKIFPQNLGNSCDQDVDYFLISCNKILDQHASPKSKYVRGNHLPFMNKNLSKALMLRTKLRNIFLKNRNEENKGKYIKQRTLCATLLGKSKRKYFGNLNEKNVCDNKKFWRVVKPLLSNKIISNEKITIVECDKIIRSDKETAKVLNEFFSNAAANLNIPQFNQIGRTSENISDPVIKAFVKYRAHLSIIAIKENCTSKSNFNSSFVEKVDILNEIKMLQSNKATQNTDIPTILIKDNADVFAEFVFISLNKCIEQSVFPSKLKLANITPVHKKTLKKLKRKLQACQYFVKYI